MAWRGVANTGSLLLSTLQAKSRGVFSPVHVLRAVRTFPVAFGLAQLSARPRAGATDAVALDFSAGRQRAAAHGGAFVYYVLQPAGTPPPRTG